MKNIVLCPNMKRDPELELTLRVKKMLEECGAVISVCPMFGDIPASAGVRTADLTRALCAAELVIAFGGDGTILHTARAAAVKQIPVIGVNMGSKGFMAEVEQDDIGILKRVLENNYTIENRMMLDVSLLRGNKEIKKDFALNDVVLGTIARMVNISVYGDGNKISGFSGDGLVVCTPTGSTAYSMSAGGPIVEPWAENIIVTPICAHVLAAKAFVLAPSRIVTVEMGDLNSKKAYMSVDGGDTIRLETGDILKIEKSEYSVKLIKISDKSFYQTVNEKLGER